jgi:hypothetical protein
MAAVFFPRPGLSLSGLLTFLHRLCIQIRRTEFISFVWQRTVLFGRLSVRPVRRCYTQHTCFTLHMEHATTYCVTYSLHSIEKEMLSSAATSSEYLKFTIKIIILYMVFRKS